MLFNLKVHRYLYLKPSSLIQILADKTLYASEHPLSSSQHVGLIFTVEIIISMIPLQLEVSLTESRFDYVLVHKVSQGLLSCLTGHHQPNAVSVLIFFAQRLLQIAVDPNILDVNL